MTATIVPLIDAATIGKRIGEMGKEIGEAYEGKPLTLLVCLKGAYLFAADLSRAIAVPHQISFVRVGSYGAGTVSTGEVAIEGLQEGELEGRDVLVVEDIVDTGQTASTLIERLRATGIGSVRLCALLDKPSRRIVATSPDFVGFSIENRFVVGYGLDHAEAGRHLPFIGVYEETIR